MYFSFDIELTGPKRNFDRIIEIGAVAFDDTGQICGTFDERINPDGVKITPKAYEIHSISDKDLVRCDRFDIVGKRFCEWMSSKLGALDCGILVAHNGNCCDFQFICCKMLRHNMKFPDTVRYTLDTLDLIRHFKALDYHTYDADAWPSRTGKLKKPSMSLRPVVEFLLKHPNRIKLHGGGFDVKKGDGSFRVVCGC
jgi:DNA polymerase III epsilon subunit-like protein